MRITLAVLAFLFCVGGAFALDVPASDKGDKKQLDHSKDGNKNPDKNKISIVVSPTITSAAPSTYQAHHEDNGAYWEAVTAISTFILACITFGLAFFTLRLWRSTGDLVKGSESTAKRQLKAYLGIARPEVRLNSYEGQLLAWIEYINSGQTPAFDLVIRMSAEIRDFNSPPPTRKPGVPEDELKGGILVPDVPWRRHVSVDRVSTTTYTEIVKDLQEERKKIWVWGTMDYTDAFTNPHHIEFRFWNSRVVRTHEPNDRDTGQYFPLIAEREGTKADYGKN